ncbi:MAG: hypothetical protein KVP17_003826 [Porospora cf. gigantea B]|uniref:uncharacterized protein n=2 Tax=Porospora cf. gigantea B TaxID=2853592 RepID=UPI003571B81D|nr:MAG: hypothetical protein KVP17_003826 [Porospora cf. gigantea B]
MRAIRTMKSRLTNYVDHDDDEEEAKLIDVDYTEEVTAEKLRLWLRRCKRKYRNGVFVIKVGQTGKLLQRTVFIGLKPEYFEITSKKFFDVGYHMSDIVEVDAGTKSEDFEELDRILPVGSPRPAWQKCCVVRTESRDVSLVFEYEADRRDFMFLIMVEKQAVGTRYALVKERFEAHQDEMQGTSSV